MQEVYVNDVIQATGGAGEWCGCLLQVDEVKPWGYRHIYTFQIKGTHI